MLKPINSIIKDSIGNIMFRGNVVTGIVATDNGNGSYDVFISESDRAYPKIFTLSRNPDLAVGDKVRILYKNGCKELPIILPPVKPTAPPPPPSGIVAVSYWISGPIYKIKTFDTNGNEIVDFVTGAVTSDNQWITMDSSGNIYLLEDTNNLTKYNSSGVQQNQLNIQNSYAIDIGSDGYLYTLEVAVSGYDVKRRSTTDLSEIATVNFGIGKSYRGFAVDSDENLYLGEKDADVIEKRSFSTGNLLASKAINSSVFTFNRQHLGILGINIYGAGGLSGWQGWYMPKALDTNATQWSDDDFPEAVTIHNNADIYAIGWDGSNYVIKKYNSSRELQWSKTIISSGGIMAVGACSFN